MAIEIICCDRLKVLWDSTLDSHAIHLTSISLQWLLHSLSSLSCCCSISHIPYVIFLHFVIITVGSSWGSSGSVLQIAARLRTSARRLRGPICGVTRLTCSFTDIHSDKPSWNLLWSLASVLWSCLIWQVSRQKDRSGQWDRKTIKKCSHTMRSYAVDSVEFAISSFQLLRLY